MKQFLDGLAQNARPLSAALFLLFVLSFLLRSNLAKRLWKGIEDAVSMSWQLGLLGTTGLILSLASGYTTWDGMRNFTGEPLLSGMITFGIQGVMLIAAWLIGETFATGMNMQSQKTRSSLVNPALQNWIGAGIGLLLFIAGFALLLQWSGQADVRQASAESLSWDKTGDKMLIFAFGLLMVALFTLYAASDLIKPYIQGSRIVIRNSLLWVMFLSCMTTSVFFSFDSLFTSIFPQSERVRAAELRAQNQVAGIIADIEQTIGQRTGVVANELFEHEAWAEYEGKLTALASLAKSSQGAIERYVNAQIEDRRRAVKEQQERMASAQSGQAGLAARKLSLTEEKGRLAGQRPELATEYAAKKAELDAKGREVDAKRVEAMAEDKGVEGTGREGKGPVWRQRMGELNLLQNAYKIAEERMRDAQKRLAAVESRLVTIDSELATIDGDLAKLKGEAETAAQRIEVAEDNIKDDVGQKLDPSRLVPSFEGAMTAFREKPTSEQLASLQKLCGDVHGALAATPETSGQLSGLDCDPKRTVDAASNLFALQAGAAIFSASCSGGDKLEANKGTDALFAFARRCLADTALPSSDTDTLRAKINHIELSRDDKAHRFVVTWNAFQDGNRLAYLALAIAIAIDSLIFMSGLFGANAVRSPLSDVPTFKARSAAQLEATINAALGPHPHETAWLTLNALRPMNFSDGFSALADLSVLDKPTADRVRMVLTAGAGIGAVETASLDPECYRVRSELREYLSSVCDRHYKTDASAKEKARLMQLVGAALEPYPREHADLVLHTLEPIREIEGFTSQIQLGDVKDAYEARVVRRVMNAGATVKAVRPNPSQPDLYDVSPVLYETLLTIRATATESAGYDNDRRRYRGVSEGPVLEGGQFGKHLNSVGQNVQQRALPNASTEAAPPNAVNSADQLHELTREYTAQLIDALDIDSRGYLQMDSAIHGAAARACEVFKRLRESNEALQVNLIRADEIAQRQIDDAHRALAAKIKPSESMKKLALQAASKTIEDDWLVLMLLPRGPYERALEALIEPLEDANGDGRLSSDDQHLLRALRRLRQPLYASRRDSEADWKIMEQALSKSYAEDMPRNTRDRGGQTLN